MLVRNDNSERQKKDGLLSYFAGWSIPNKKEPNKYP